MAEVVTIDKVYAELKDLKKEVFLMKKQMIDPDTLMTIEENVQFKKSMQEFNEGKSVPLSKIKQELRL